MIENKIIVGFTGTHMGMTDWQRSSVEMVLRGESVVKGLLDIIRLAVHGGCVGADDEFNQICCDLSIPVEIHPGDIPHKRADCSTQNVVKVHSPVYPLVRNVQL